MKKKRMDAIMWSVGRWVTVRQKRFWEQTSMYTSRTVARERAKALDCTVRRAEVYFVTT